MMKLQYEKWEASELILTPAKLVDLWKTLQDHKTLFADQERGDFKAWLATMESPGVFWIEVCELGKLVGLVYFTGVDQFDVTCNFIYLDRKPSEKVSITRAIIGYVFDNFPVQRMTVVNPRIYHAANRLVDKLGFRREGCKRQAVLIGGKWIDELIFGLLRGEM